MNTNVKARPGHHIRMAARRFARDVAGVAAVEFAYIAPILLVMLMATFELSRGVSIDRRLNSVSAMASELVAREGEVAAADLLNIYRALDHVMKPYNDNSLVVRLTQVRTNNNSVAQVEWSSEINSTMVQSTSGGTPTTPYPHCSTFNLDAELKQRGSRVIVAEVGYNYQPMFGNFVYRDFNFDNLKQTRNDVSGLAGTWSSKAYHAPRWNCVAYGSSNCVTCPES